MPLHDRDFVRLTFDRLTPEHRARAYAAAALYYGFNRRELEAWRD